MGNWKIGHVYVWGYHPPLLSDKQTGKTIVLPQTFHKHISQKNTHTYLTLREEYNNNWTQRRGGGKHNKHP